MGDDMTTTSSPSASAGLVQRQLNGYVHSVTRPSVQVQDFSDLVLLDQAAYKLGEVDCPGMTNSRTLCQPVVRMSIVPGSCRNGARHNALWSFGMSAFSRNVNSVDGVRKALDTVAGTRRKLPDGIECPEAASSLSLGSPHGLREPVATTPPRLNITYFPCGNGPRSVSLELRRGLFSKLVISSLQGRVRALGRYVRLAGRP